MSVRHIVAALTLLVPLSSPRSFLFGQSPKENWLKAPKTEIVRDTEAIAILQASQAAMNPQQKPEIIDHTIEGRVDKWMGKNSTGVLRERSIGLHTSSATVTINDHQAFHLIKSEHYGSVAATEDSPVQISDGRLVEALPRTPIPLLQEILRDPNDSIELVASPDSTSTDQHVRAHIHLPGWQPKMRNTDTATLDIYIEPSSKLISRITQNIHFDGNLNHTIPYEMIFSDYREVSGWVIPTTIEERYVGRLMNHITVNAFSTNGGLLPSDLSH